jgi:hypothetical protein
MVDATGTSVLGGTVVADDGSGRPVRRAVVTVSGASLPGRMLLSDDDGHFVFTGLPAGSYSVVVRKPGWLIGHHGARESWKGPGTPVALGDGERRTDLELRLAPGAVVTGRLLDPFGRPQAGANVLVFERRRYGGRDTFVMAGDVVYSWTQTTDDRGVFRIFGLPPGDFIVGANVVAGVTAARAMASPEALRWAEQARRAGLTGSSPPPAPGPTVAYTPVFHPGVTDIAGAPILTLGVGEERSGVDFQLQLVPSVAVRGRLTMPDGRPAAGVPLLMTSPEGSTISGLAVLQNMSRDRARSGRDGRFAFQSVTPGDYLVIARGTTEPQAPLWADEPVSVGSQDVEGLEVRMQPGRTISGRLVFSGTVLEPPEDLKQVTLGVAEVEQGGMSVRVPAVRASADGTFEITGLAPGRYVLTAELPSAAGRDGASWLAHRAEMDGGNLLDVPFEVRPSDDLDGVVVEFSDRPAELSGQVTDGQGRPVPGLTMVLFGTDPAAWAAPVSERSRRTSPLDSNGRFRMSSLPPGDYYLAALAEVAGADLADPAYLEQVAASAIRITLALGERKVQDFQLGGIERQQRDDAPVVARESDERTRIEGESGHLPTAGVSFAAEDPARDRPRAVRRR